MNRWPLRHRCSALPTELTSQLLDSYYTTRFSGVLNCEDLLISALHRSAIYEFHISKIIILLIVFFSLLITKSLFSVTKEKICLFDIYFQIWKVFKNGYFHICITSKETQSCKTRHNTSPNLSWHAGVFLTTYSFLRVRYKARGNFREFEICVRVGRDEASAGTIVNFSSTVDKLWRPVPSFSISINKLSCLLHYWKLIVITKGESLIAEENRRNKNWITFLLQLQKMVCWCDTLILLLFCF